MELSQPVELNDKIWPVCLPDSPNSDPDHLKGDFGIVVGYGPENEDSVNLNQLRHKIEPKWICDGIYDPANVAIGNENKEK